MREHQTSNPSGWSDWRTPSPIELLMQIKGQLGGLETGQRMTLDAVKTIFAQIDDLQGRVSVLECRPATDDSPELSRPRGLLSAAREILAAFKDLILAIANLRELALLGAVLVLGLMGLMSPKEIKETLLTLPAIEETTP